MVRADIEAAPLTASDFRAYIDEQSGGAGVADDGMIASLRAMTPYDSQPVLGSISCYRDGTILVELFRSPGVRQNRHLVFDDSWQLKGVLSVPLGLRIMDISDGKVLYATENSDGIVELRLTSLETRS